MNYEAAVSCVIDANQAGNANSTVSAAGPASHHGLPGARARAGQPAADRDSRAARRFTFEASGTPEHSYALAYRARSWLSINANTGEVTGTPSAGTTSFQLHGHRGNAACSATAGLFTLTVTEPSPGADISTVLSCPAGLTKGVVAGRCRAVRGAGGLRPRRRQRHGDQDLNGNCGPALATVRGQAPVWPRRIMPVNAGSSRQLGSPRFSRSPRCCTGHSGPALASSGSPPKASMIFHVSRCMAR